MQEVKWRIGKYLYKLKQEIHPHKRVFAFPYSKILLDEVRQFEGAKFDWDTKTWTIANSSRNQYQLSQLEYPSNWVDPYSQQEQVQSCDLRNHSHLRPKQVEAIHHILNYRRCIIAYEMGMGKCLITYTVLNILTNISSVWIICPLNVKLAWLAEFEKWQHKLPALDPKKIHIFNYEKLEQVLKDAEKPPEVIVFDESVYVKNPNSKRSQLSKELCRLSREQYSNPFIICLCGTPAPKDPTDWWHQTELCHPGFLRESSPIKLKYRLGEFKEKENEFGKYKELVAWKHEEVELLYRRLKGMVLTGTQEKGYNYIEETITPDKRTQDIAKLLASQAKTSIELLTKLRELSDGFIYEEGGKYTNVLNFNEAKAERLKGNLATLLDNGENRCIIYAAFMASVDKCIEVAKATKWNIISVDSRGWRWFGEAGFTNKPNEMYHRFQQADLFKLPIAIIGHPASLGEGLSLPCNYIFFFSNDFNPKNRQQAEARSRNLHVTIYDYIHLSTDKHVLGNLKLSKTLQSISLGQIVDWINEGMIV